MFRRSGSIVVSGALHVAIVAVTSVYWAPSLALPEDEDSHVVPVEFVTSIAEQTNIAPTVQRDVPPPVAAPLAEVSAPKIDLGDMPDPSPVEVEPPAPDPVPTPPMPAPTPAPVAEEPAPPQKLANLVAPKRKPPPPKKPQFDVDSVLQLLDKNRARPAPPPPNAKLADTSVRGIGAQNAQTVDLKDALLSQMRACWNVPVGAPEPEKLIVEVRVFLSQSGALARPPQLEPSTRAAIASNPYMRTAAEAALRAVSVCEPYKLLPVERYDSWREIVMIFDPSKVVGR